MGEEPEPMWPMLVVVAVIAVATFVGSMSLDWWGNTVFRSTLVTCVVLVLLADIQMIRHYRQNRKRDVPKTDERLERLIAHAMAHSFRVGILFMTALIFANLTLVTMDVVIALSLSVFVMAGTYFIAYWYFNRKGDVQVGA
ncbi:MAG: hypothetical protein HXS41_12850 [Theionarchaea archaeon]|nr:hypothetical protein [Theionarchaea archaeon]MBU7021941.1 hypothetical protein [Theionarchaea archaeon]MBU7035216.1 hypothetical protein [Theionarchaea archaeon]